MSGFEDTKDNNQAEQKSEKTAEAVDLQKKVDEVREILSKFIDSAKKPDQDAFKFPKPKSDLPELELLNRVQDQLEFNVLLNRKQNRPLATLIIGEIEKGKKALAEGGADSELVATSRYKTALALFEKHKEKLILEPKLSTELTTVLLGLSKHLDLFLSNAEDRNTVINLLSKADKDSLEAFSKFLESKAFKNAFDFDKHKILVIAAGSNHDGIANLIVLLSKETEQNNKSILNNRDAEGKSTLDNLYALAKTVPADLEKHINQVELLSSILAALVELGEVHQDTKSACAAGVLEKRLITENPAEYVRLVAGLAGKKGEVATAIAVKEKDIKVGRMDQDFSIGYDLKNFLHAVKLEDPSNDQITQMVNRLIKSGINLGEPIPYTLKRATDVRGADNSNRLLSSVLFQSAILEAASDNLYSNEHDLQVDTVTGDTNQTGMSTFMISTIATALFAEKYCVVNNAEHDNALLGQLANEKPEINIDSIKSSSIQLSVEKPLSFINNSDYPVIAAINLSFNTIEKNHDAGGHAVLITKIEDGMVYLYNPWPKYRLESVDYDVTKKLGHEIVSAEAQLYRVPIDKFMENLRSIVIPDRRLQSPLKAIKEAAPPPKEAAPAAPKLKRSL